MSTPQNTPTKHKESSDDECIPETPQTKPRLQPSEAAKFFMGKRTPTNTVRANSTSLRALARFLTSAPGYVEIAFRGEEHMRSLVMSNKEERTAWELEEARKILFPDGKGGTLVEGYDEWTTEELMTVRHFLIEFVVNYRSVRSNAEVKPSTMKGYILGIQRSFVSDWGYKLKLLEGPIFNCPSEGLMAVIDNRFSLQQSKGMFTESHNVLSADDLMRLYTSDSLSRQTAAGFQARLVFDIALSTAMRSSALVSLTINQFSKQTRKGEDVWKITSAVGSKIGASKTKAGGWNAVREKPTEVVLWNRDCLGGKLNIFKDIDDYMRVRVSMECGSDRFFLAANHKGQSLQEFFKRQHLGQNSFGRIVQDVCKREGIYGCGVKNGMTTHGLRGTVTTMLLEAGHADSSVAMRTGHRDVRSLKNYQNLEGALGEKQQNDIFAFAEASDHTPTPTGTDNNGGGVAKRVKFEEDGKDTTKGVANATGVKSEARVGGGVLTSDENRALIKEENDTTDDATGVLRLLSDVKHISGGSFSVNVHNHYR